MSFRLLRFAVGACPPVANHGRQGEISAKGG